MKKVIKLSLIWLLALPLLLAGCNKDEPAPECKEVFLDTANIKLEVYKVISNYAFVNGNKVEILDTIFKDLDGVVGDIQILKPSIPFEDLIVMTDWGDTLKGDVKHGYVCRPNLTRQYIFATFKFIGKGHYRLKRCGKPDTLIYKEIKGDKIVYNSNFVTLYPRNFNKTVYAVSESGKKDSIHIDLVFEGETDTISDKPNSYWPYRMYISGSIPNIKYMNSTLMLTAYNKISASSDGSSNSCTSFVGTLDANRQFKLYVLFTEINNKNPRPRLVEFK